MFLSLPFNVHLFWLCNLIQIKKYILKSMPHLWINSEIKNVSILFPVPVCKSLEENRCAKFGYDKVGSENPHNFADLQFLVSNGCYDHALEFICVTSYPPCEDNRQRYPCKQFCERRYRLHSISYGVIFCQVKQKYQNVHFILNVISSRFSHFEKLQIHNM